MPEGTYVLPFDTFATVTLQYAVISPFLQVIVAVPTPLPVTRPLLSTEATPLLLLLQLTLLFDALLGCTEAVSCAEFPTPNVILVLLSVIPVTPCLTTTVHDADFLLPSVVTHVTVAVPGYAGYYSVINRNHIVIAAAPL